MTEEELKESNELLSARQQMMEVQNLPIDTQLKIAAKMIGYRAMPPDVTTFIEDEYYMGNITQNLYPFWKEQMQEIFPTPIHTRYPIVVITGGIGTGKSTFSKLCTAYMQCRLDHLYNPHKTMGLMPGKKILFNFLMPTAGAAASEFIGALYGDGEDEPGWYHMSPYFDTGMYNGLSGYEYTAEGDRGKGRIGRDVIMYVLSELNFFRRDVAQAKLDTAFNRWDSRFHIWTDYFGMMIIDTSSKHDDSIAEDFAMNNPYGDKVKVIRTNMWKVREHLHYYGRKGWFKVYAGDSIHSAFIVNENNPILPDMDPDRIIEVPEEVRPDFEMNLEQALQDKAGISTTATDKFIQEFKKVEPCFNRPLVYPQLINMDFYDRADKLWYYLDEAIRQIPTDKIVFLHYDIGVTGDAAGLAVSYFDSWQDYGIDKTTNKRMRLPKIVTPIAVAIGRKSEQETSIFKLQEFVIDLADRNELYFSADSFCSRQLMQNLQMLEIQNSYISVDRTDTAYITLKTLLLNGLISLPNHPVLKKELAEVKRQGHKFDHPVGGCFTGSTEVIVRYEGEVFEMTIEDLVDNYIDHEVLTYNGVEYCWSKIEQGVLTKYVNELLKLELESGDIIYCTPDHPILTSQGYVPASELTQEHDIISITNPY